MVDPDSSRSRHDERNSDASNRSEKSFLIGLIGLLGFGAATESVTWKPTSEAGVRVQRVLRVAVATVALALVIALTALILASTFGWI